MLTHSEYYFELDGFFILFLNQTIWIWNNPKKKKKGNTKKALFKMGENRQAVMSIVFRHRWRRADGYRIVWNSADGLLIIHLLDVPLPMLMAIIAQRVHPGFSSSPPPAPNPPNQLKQNSGLVINPFEAHRWQGACNPVQSSQTLNVLSTEW